MKVERHQAIKNPDQKQSKEDRQIIKKYLNIPLYRELAYYRRQADFVQILISAVTRKWFENLEHLFTKLNVNCILLSNMFSFFLESVYNLTVENKNHI